MKNITVTYDRLRVWIGGRFRRVLVVMAVVTTSLLGCQKFLNVDALDSLSGNNFWATEKDVEDYTIGIYAQFRKAILNNYMICTATDWRAGYWVPYTGAPGGSRTFITLIAQNNVPAIIRRGAVFAGSNSTYWGYPDMLPNAWEAFYKMIAASNILISKVDEVPDTQFSESSRKRYKAEAVYLRSLAYFYLVRLFGDVPYYTEAYHSEALGKTNQVYILQQCAQELASVSEDLPWSYDDPANVAVRAMRGGALITSMEMNMWMAGFDQGNKEAYWRTTDSLGNILINQNENNYELLPIERYPVVFRGKSKEGLVELSRNANYNEGGYGFDGRNYDISGYATKSPPGNPTGYSFMFISKDFMEKLYPPSEPDRRKDLWFPASFIYAGNKDFEFYKYYDFSQAGNGDYPRGSVVIYRYADAFLLRAEALFNLGQETEAAEMLNVVRARAGAPNYTTNDEMGLGDAIWQERVKEFMGESKYYWDLVRTGRILDGKYCLHPIGVEAFREGAWTWPIPDVARDDNPKLSLDGYWTNLQ